MSVDNLNKLRKRLLKWHSNKQRSIEIIDLLESGYQGFRRKVCNRIGEDLCFREAIKRATQEELERLQNHIDEEYADKRRNK